MSAIGSFSGLRRSVLVKCCPCGEQPITLLPLLTFVRWRKDPRLPKAPSKLYNVRQPTPRVPAETEFLKKNTDIYRTKCRAIWNLVAEQYADAEKITSSNVQEQHLVDRDDAVRLNDEWNAVVARERILRQAARNDERDRLRQEAMLQSELLRESQQKRAVDLVHKNKDLAGKAIDVEKLDEEIEKLLSIVKDPSFALDPGTGEFISGSTERAAASSGSGRRADNRGRSARGTAKLGNPAP